MIKVVECLDLAGKSRFGRWFDSLEARAALKVTRAVARMEAGNFGDMKSVGAGVSECRIDFGPGYRIYFGRDGMDIVMLLGGGTKKRQQSDIAAALDLWAVYKARKKGS
jgi:putative addiction module killer protein